MQNTKPISRRARLQVESLEDRAVAATLVSPTTATYQDVDGDQVRVSFSKPILRADNVNSVFGFFPGSVDGSTTVPQQLRWIDLTHLGAAAARIAITVTAVRPPAGTGDGLAAIGHIDATGIDLGAVTIDGDLGRIVAGDATTGTVGLRGLTVQSMGRFGVTTGAPDLRSRVQGE